MLEHYKNNKVRLDPNICPFFQQNTYRWFYVVFIFHFLVATSAPFIIIIIIIIHYLHLIMRLKVVNQRWILWQRLINIFKYFKNPFHGAKDIFEFVSCWPGPDDNQVNWKPIFGCSIFFKFTFVIKKITRLKVFYLQNNSWLTFYSSGGLSFGIVNIVGNFGAVFVDQSYWQSAVATKPKRGRQSP